MIYTRQDIKKYLHADLVHYYGDKENVKEPGFISWFLHNEIWYIWKYLKCLRHYEYYTNNKNKSIFHRILWLLYARKHKILSTKYHYFIYPNTCDAGLSIYHCGPIIFSQKCKVGKNLICRTGCVIASDINGNSVSVEIGDNVTLSLGVKVLCKKVGRGAFLNANSVIMNNVPPYAIVAGNPGKVVGFTKRPEEIIELESSIYPEAERIPKAILEKNYDRFFNKRLNTINDFIQL